MVCSSLAKCYGNSSKEHKGTHTHVIGYIRHIYISYYLSLETYTVYYYLATFVYQNDKPTNYC